jgi:hypothetical protein
MMQTHIRYARMKLGAGPCTNCAAAWGNGRIVILHIAAAATSAS